MSIESTDRYGGGPGPDLETMCKGQCEGHGWYYIKCPDCNGTGKQQ